MEGRSGGILRGGIKPNECVLKKVAHSFKVHAGSTGCDDRITDSRSICSGSHGVCVNGDSGMFWNRGASQTHPLPHHIND